MTNRQIEKKLKREQELHRYKSEVAVWNKDGKMMGNVYGTFYEIVIANKLPQDCILTFSKLNVNSINKIKQKYMGINVSHMFGNKLDDYSYLNMLLNRFKRFVNIDDGSGYCCFEDIEYRFSEYRSHIQMYKDRDRNGFEQALSNLVIDNPQIERIEDLNVVRAVSGIYIMVLDEYNSFYVGQSVDIAKRIVAHWNKTNAGTFGIDMFKALDTSEIYVFRENDTNNLDYIEALLINGVLSQYLLNFMPYNLYSEDNKVHEIEIKGGILERPIPPKNKLDLGWLFDKE